MKSRSTVYGIMEKSTIFPQILASVTATMTAMSGGFLMAWPSPMLVKLQAEDSTLPVTSDQGSWITSILYFGCILGSVVTLATVNRWGRKLPLLSMSIPIAVACVLISTAQNYWWLIISRLISGITYGVAYTILPIYLGEIADDRVRGMLGVIINQMMSLGVVLAYCVGPWVDHVLLGGIGLILPILFGLTFAWMPESPYYLVMKKRSKQAEKSLRWLRGTSDVTEELGQIEENVKIDRRNTGTVKELIMSPGNRKALMITTVLMLAPQLSGIGAVLAYTGLIFEASGSELSLSTSLIIIGVIQFLAGLLGMFTVDLLGRRPLLLFSTCTSIVFLAGEAVYFQLQASEIDVSGISWLPLAAMVGYILGYSIALGSVPYVILSELFPCNVKVIAGSYAGNLVALSGMAVTKLYQIIADAYGIHASFWVFVGCSVLSFTIIYFFLPETKQRSLRVIHDELRGLKKSEIISETAEIYM